MTKQPAVDAQTSIGEKKTRKERAKKPLELKQIREGALKLPLAERATLCKELKESVSEEAATIADDAKLALQIVGNI